MRSVKTAPVLSNWYDRTGSDLDLVLCGPNLKEIPIGQLGGFREAVRESTIPFIVEVNDWAYLPERFQREIERNHVVLMPNAGGDNSRGHVGYPGRPSPIG